MYVCTYVRTTLAELPDFDHVCAPYMYTHVRTAVKMTRYGLYDTQVGRTGSRTYVKVRTHSHLLLVPLQSCWQCWVEEHLAQ